MIRISSRVSIITKGNRIQFICNFSSKRGKIVAFQRLYLNSYKSSCITATFTTVLLFSESVTEVISTGLKKNSELLVELS